MDDAQQQSIDFYKDPENQIPAGPAYRRAAPRLSSTVPVRFPQDMIAAVKRLADLDGMTVSSWIRALIAKEIKRRVPPVTLTAATGPENGMQQGSPETSSAGTAHAELIAC
jgi:predicted DNA binding CopG/RHH family protein